MIALFVTVFVVIAASVVGSLHCAGMCGPFVAIALAPAGGATEKRGVWDAVSPALAYHFGRLATYALLGAVCGAIGAAIDLGGTMVGLARAAAILAGGTMIVFGLVMIAQLRGATLGRYDGGGWLKPWLMRAQRAAMRLTPLRRAAVIGLLTTLLPCGWLWAFAVTATGTASPLWGALVMAAFWAGTVPALAALGVALRSLTGAFATRLPWITAAALVIVGLVTVFHRLELSPKMFDTSTAQAVTTDEAIERVKNLSDDHGSCCDK